MRKRTRLAQAVILLILALLLFASAGCQAGTGQQASQAGGATPGTRTATPAAGGVVTIRLAYLPRSEESVMLDLLIAAFQEEHPEYRVEKVSLGYEDQSARIADLFIRGETDLLSVTMDEGQGMLLPLDPYIARSGLDLKPYGSMVEYLRDEGTLFGLPYGLRTSLLVYNKEMLQAAGVREPSDGWTWEEFRQALRTLTAGTGEQQVLGLDTGRLDYLARAYVEEKSGGPFYQAPPEVVGEALQFLSAMVLDDRSMPKAAVPKKGGGPVGNVDRLPWMAFIERRAAMMLENPISLGNLTTLPMSQWAIAPMPTHPGTQPVGVGEAISLGIFQKAPQPDAAWAFIRFATGEEGAAILARAGFPTVYVSDAVREAWGQQQRPLPAGADTIWQTRWVPWWPASQDWRGKEILFRRAFERTLSGSATWEDVLAEYTRDINRQ